MAEVGQRLPKSIAHTIIFKQNIKRCALEHDQVILNLDLCKGSTLHGYVSIMVYHVSLLLHTFLDVPQ